MRVVSIKGNKLYYTFHSILLKTVILFKLQGHQVAEKTQITPSKQSSKGLVYHSGTPDRQTKDNSFAN